MTELPRRRSRLFGILALLLVNICWGLSFIASKYALTAGLPPMTLACARYLITVAIMTPLVLLREGSLRIARGDWLWAALSALLGITFYYFFEYTGMVYTTASTASLILAVVPMMQLLYNVLFCRHRARVMDWLCVGLSLLGVFFIIAFGGQGLEGAGSLKGNLLILGCCVCWVAYVQISTRLRGKYTGLRLTSWQALLGLATLIPFALAEKSHWVPVSLSVWVCVAGLALICSALCYFLYAEALSALDSFTVALFMNINPIAGVIGGALLLGERLTPLQLGGGALIILSLLLSNRRPAPPKDA